MKPWDLYSVLTQKYCWSSKDAREFSDFLIPMLDFDTRRRATAWDCLNHEWIKTERTNQVSLNDSKHKSENRLSSADILIKSPKTNQPSTSTRYYERKMDNQHNKSRDNNKDNDAKFSSKSSYSTDHENLILEKSSYKKS